MWFIGPILKIFEYGSGILSTWVTHKANLREAKQAGELQWAQTMAEASKSSWKDEYFVILFTAPIALAIVGIDGPLTTLLAILETAPGWYTTVILTMVGASFGVNLHDRYKTGIVKAEYIREVIRKNGNGKADPYAGVRPSPLPPEA
jgi:hypothetical protein